MFRTGYSSILTNGRAESKKFRHRHLESSLPRGLWLPRHSQALFYSFVKMAISLIARGNKLLAQIIKIVSLTCLCFSQ